MRMKQEQHAIKTTSCINLIGTTPLTEHAHQYEHKDQGLVYAGGL